MKPDVNYQSYSNVHDLTIDSWENPANPADYDDIMKFSNCSNVKVSGVTVFGGREDCIDVVRGFNYSFEDMALEPLVNGVTIKGSASNVTLKNITFWKTGKKYSIELGQFDNYWYAGRPPTRSVTIENVTSKDGKKIIVPVWDAEKPVVINSPDVIIKKIPKFIWYPYFLLRRWQVKLASKSTSSAK